MAEMNDELLIKFLLGETTSPEEQLVKKWIAAGAENERHFKQIQTIWSASRNLIPQTTIDTDQAWEQFRARRDAADVKPEAPVRQLSSRFAWIKIAAVLLVAAGGAWTLYSYFHRGYTTLASAAVVQTQTLPDGSAITLNKNTSISYREGFDDHERRVKLDSGEVFFRVRPDKTKPFVIDANDVTVSVLGTSFNVRHRADETEVIVESGLVEVRTANQKVLLQRGEKVTVHKTSLALQKEVITDNLHNYFRSNRFKADNTPLWRVVEVLNEAYDVEIVLEEPRSKDLRLTTTFETESLDAILAVIAETFELQVERKGRQIILK